MSIPNFAERLRAYRLNRDLSYRALEQQILEATGYRVSFGTLQDLCCQNPSRTANERTRHKIEQFLATVTVKASTAKASKKPRPRRRRAA